MHPIRPAFMLMAMLLGGPVAAQPSPDPVADSIVRNLTRGLRIQGQGGTPPTSETAPPVPGVDARTTAQPGQGAVSLMIVFATGSDALTPESQALVASLARALGTEPLTTVRFRIEGHTDTVGGMAMNQALSERRAKAVRDALVTRFGIDPARLETRGYGETQLLVPTPDGQGEIRNRRVQVVTLAP
ncbi:OmpA family protein [Roseomonas sp. HJA6]|uniref:OmpA family protein n=1 Tax=Roseomonas alba TaxID=2846776 RepID=A0ABS7AFN7_9PROT|nr:OmpA family protein [Neoroseomonas alba]MBW6400973.1 OmpA family protein [Neoroseomonas alba]